MDRHIPLVISEGEPFARGQHLGSSQKERVLHTVKAYLQMFEHFAGLGRAAVYEQAERFLPAIQEVAPHLLEEMRGIAEGAGVTFGDVLALNVRSEVMFASAGQGRANLSTVLANEDPVGYTPDVDGVVLKQSIKTALASGQFNRVPVMIGTNHDEYRLFVAIYALLGAKMTAANYQDMIASTLSVAATAAAAIAAPYPLSRFYSPAVALGAVGTDAIFACNSLSQGESLARYVPTYAYEFNDENAPELFLPPVGFPYGAAHASELQYLFSQTAVPHPADLTAAQQQLATAMKQDWTTMAKTGVPAAGWPRFSSARQQILSLVPPQPKVETNFSAQHQCAFWIAAEANR